MLQLPLIALICVTLYWSAAQFRLGRANVAILPGLAASAYLFALLIPAYLQSAGLISSKLDRVGIAFAPSTAEIAELALKWAAELGAILCGAAVVTFGLVRLPLKHLKVHQPLRRTRARDVWICNILFVIGFASFLLIPTAPLEERGQGGQGVAILLKTFLIVAVSMCAYFNFFGRNVYRALAAVAVILFALSGIRSPLLVVICGYAAGLVSRRSVGLKAIGILVGLALTFLCVGAVMSAMRANVIRYQNRSASEIVSETAQRPIMAAYESGLDTLDGYRLVQRIAPHERPQPLGVLTVLTNFVPRQLWPGKPTDPTVEISARWLGYGTSGQFLSPAGYFTLAFGSWAWAITGLFVFGLLFQAANIAFSRSFLLSITTCVSIRFLIGGSPFDLYYGLTLALPLGAARVIYSLTPRRLGSSTTPDRPITPAR